MTDRDWRELADLTIAYDSLRSRTRALAFAHLRVLPYVHAYPAGEIARQVRATEALIVELRDEKPVPPVGHRQNDDLEDLGNDRDANVPTPRG